MSLLEPGARVSDAVVVDRPLGQGAFAEVYRVRHEYLGWQALKLFKRVGSLGETRAMLDEARLLSTIGHPNIVRLFDAGTVRTGHGTRGFFTMEYVAGGSLERLVDSYRGIVPADIAVGVAEQLANGLAVAHAQNPPIIHRDLTLANVLVGYDAGGLRVRISDFGLARRADPVSLLASAQGTYAFMAPEVVREDGYSRAGDVWSIGTIAYLLLTNSLPYAAKTEAGLRSTRRFEETPLPPSAYNDEVDAELDDIIMSTLEPEPSLRPRDAGALARRFHDRQTKSVRVATPPTPAPSDRAQRLAAEALELARRPETLAEAADRMEEAVTRSPRLRDQHMAKLLLWRRGVMM
ncbi:serine/threonine-protein kinase [Fodinicola acaciae]|uniref:serine/threonine-protein kinase n=1 Tax=Fodinicola acaciae TaxID=2681555 RepID=UPI0013D5A00E|nr:serine/threonine-protein kinase [Fodinicola acaciae]